MKANEIYRTYAQIDLGSIVHNGKIIKDTFKNKKIMSVLKADAYGHGIEGVVPAYETFTDWYAVATIEEGLQIRLQSDKPILIFGPLPEGQIETAAKNDLTLTVGSVAYAEKVSAKLGEAGLRCDCHLKIDTGLNRSGIRWRENNDAIEEIKYIYSLPNLNFTGTYTHFACGEGQLDWELEFTQLQFNRFINVLETLDENGFTIGLRHASSTGGSLVHTEYQLDMVRLGMMPLGMSYSDESVRELGLQPALKWASFISQISEIEEGEAVSYGCTFRAEKDMRIAMVTCGYADGYRRVYSNKSHVLVGGKRVRVLGRVAMDYLLIDVTDVPGAKIGDEVILLGFDGTNTISAQALSEFGESVSGEVTCVISKRVPRIYKKIRKEI
ncbi:MAG: alanine racemase [Clostridia bacterium]|nr:alanine racemase [Clostridia bacterium]